jgi:endonuclease-3
MSADRKIEKLFKAVKKEFGELRGLRTSSPFDQMVLTLFAEGNSKAAAGRAVKALLKEFVDWNEIRVSSWKEIGAVLEREKLANPGGKGIALKRCLEAIFAETNRMDLGVLQQVAPEKAFQFLTKLKDFDEGALAGVLYISVGAKELHPTAKVVRVAARLGFIKTRSSLPKMKIALKGVVRRKHLFHFHNYLARIGEKYCFEKVTFCPRCPALELCPTGAEYVAAKAALDEDGPSEKRLAKKKSRTRKKPKPKSKPKKKAKPSRRSRPKKKLRKRKK